MLELHDIVILTAEILRGALTDNIVKITDASLIIFDECHHTMENHPYNMVMAEYLKVSFCLISFIFFSKTAVLIQCFRVRYCEIRAYDKNPSIIIIIIWLAGNPRLQYFAVNNVCNIKCIINPN